MSDNNKKADTPSDQQNKIDKMESLDADEMRQAEIVRKSPWQRRLIIGLFIAGILLLMAVVMNVSP